MIMKFGFEKLETSLYCVAQILFRCLEPFRCGWRVWQTDRSVISNSTI